MDEAVIDDLKQFITTTVSQATADLPTRDEMNTRFTEVDQRFEKLEKKMDARFDDLELKVDTIADAHATVLEDHDKAIKKLQQQTA